jgi:hypothetical protein
MQEQVQMSIRDAARLPPIPVCRNILRRAHPFQYPSNYYLYTLSLSRCACTVRLHLAQLLNDGGALALQPHHSLTLQGITN